MEHTAELRSVLASVSTAAGINATKRRRKRISDYFGSKTASSGPSNHPALSLSATNSLSSVDSAVSTDCGSQQSTQATSVADESQHTTPSAEPSSSRLDASVALTTEPSDWQTLSKSARRRRNKAAAQARRQQQQPPAKKAKTTGEVVAVNEDKAPRGRRKKPGKLSVFTTLPLDIVLEIFSHLHPLDVLHLARTTRELRELLMRTNSSTVWKRSLENVGDLPSCPTDMSLPSWVNLLFDTHCHNCTKASASKCIDYHLRIRLCSKCVDECLISENDLTTNDIGDELFDTILQGSPWSDVYDRGVQYAVKEVAFKYLKDLNQVSQSSDKEFLHFLETNGKLMETRRKHAKLCAEWSASRQDKRWVELKDTREARLEAIKAKLTERGYGPELEYLSIYWTNRNAISPRPNHPQLTDIPGVGKSKPLTDRVWGHVQKPLIEFMDQTRELRLRHERALTVRARRAAVYNAFIAWQRLPETLKRYRPNPAKIMPGAGDILEWDRARAIIDRGGPSSDSVDPRKLELLFQHRIHPFIENHRDEALEALECKIPSWMISYDHRGYRISQSELLQLAVTVMRCKNDLVHDYHHRDPPENKEPLLWYPEYLSHPCTSQTWMPYEETEAGENRFLMIKGIFNTKRDAWKAERLEFDEKAAKIVTNLLKHAGKDWRYIKTKDMDDHDYLRWVCLKCSFGNRCDGVRRMRVFTWRDAVQHNLSTHFGDATVQWELISSLDWARASAIEKKEHTKRGSNEADLRSYKCLHCRETTRDGLRMSWNELVKHFRQFPTHGDADDIDGKEGVLYYKPRGYVHRERPTVKMVPIRVEVERSDDWDLSDSEEMKSVPERMFKSLAGRSRCNFDDEEKRYRKMEQLLEKEAELQGTSGN